MTDERTCTDCGLEPAAHARLVEALREGELDVFARADLAADAIDLAEAEGRVRRPRPRAARVVLAAAAILLVALALGALLDRGRDTPPPPRPEEVHTPADVAAERAANLAFLARPETRERLVAVAEGAWVGVQGGDTLLTADDLGPLDLALQDAARKAGRRPAHRFTFRKGQEGRRAYDTNFNSPPFVGTQFMAETDLNFMAAGEQMQYYAGNLKPGVKMLSVRRETGKGATIPLYVGEPTTLGAVRDVYGFSTGSNAPLVLPPGVAFPRFEIPGEATLTRLGADQGLFQRYVVSLSIPELDLREVFVEGIGRPATLEQPDGSLRIGPTVWPDYGNEVAVRAVAADRPVLLLERPRWLARYPGDPFDGLPVEGLAASLAHYELAWRELVPPETWAGSGDDAPPTEARLTVVDPRASNAVLRQLVVRPWTRQARVVALLSQGLRAYEEGVLANGQLSEAEATAVRVLRDVARQQEVFRKGAHVDADGDGKGEYGTLWELTGSAAPRAKEKLRPPLLPNAYAPRPGATDLVLSGYRVRLFLPGRSRLAPGGVLRTGGGTPELGPLFDTRAITQPARDSGNVDVDLCEAHWWAYAWPETVGGATCRTFYVDADGTVYATPPWAGVYEGTALPPEYDAAFASPGRVPGGVSPALVSADGNRWVEVQAK